MLVEIPDPEVILGVIVAFLVGLGGLYGYYKVRPFVRAGSGEADASQQDRLEYYERQLIDLKIRMDAMDMQESVPKVADSSQELRQFLERLAKGSVPEGVPARQDEKVMEKTPTNTPDLGMAGHSNPTDHVLHLITGKPMTSRDIQVTLKKSREHTSRLMKRLFEDGYVQRDANSKPYTYSITEKGRMKIGKTQAGLQAA